MWNFYETYFFIVVRRSFFPLYKWDGFYEIVLLCETLTKFVSLGRSTGRFFAIESEEYFYDIIFLCEIFIKFIF